MVNNSEYLFMQSLAIHESLLEYIYFNPVSIFKRLFVASFLSFRDYIERIEIIYPGYKLVVFLILHGTLKFIQFSFNELT